MLIGYSIGEVRVTRINLSKYWAADHPDACGIYEWNDLLDVLRSSNIEIPESVVCVICGKEEILRWTSNDELRKHKMCFNCNFWREYVEKVNDDHCVRIDGKHYYYHQDEPRSSNNFKGFGGNKFYIKFFDGRDIITHNLWHQGDIPDYWKDKLPDNAEFSDRILNND